PLEGLEDQPGGGLDAADGLDHEVDVGVAHDLAGLVGEDTVGELDGSLAGHVPHRHPGHLEPQPGAGLDGVALLVDQADQRGAHVAAAEQADADPTVGHARTLPVAHSCLSGLAQVFRYLSFMTADDLDTLATRLGALAQAVREPLDRVVAYHRPDVWRGARADRFGQELADQRLRGRVAADELAAAARLLRARAELLRAFEQS